MTDGRNPRITVDISPDEVAQLYAACQHWAEHVEDVDAKADVLLAWQRIRTALLEAGR